jgi:opacity protein-like surface antigen
MKKLSAALAVLFCTLIQLAANAGNRDPSGFISIGGGASDYSITEKTPKTNQAFKFKVSPIYAMEVGYKFNKYLRAAFNPQYRVIKFSDPNNTSGTSPNINASSIVAMFNGYLDLYNYSNFTPYAVAGIGASTFSYKVKNSSTYQKSHADVAMNLSAGIGIQAAISHNAGIDLSWRYSRLGSIKLVQSNEEGQPVPSTAQKQKLSSKDVIFSLYMLL